MNTKFITPVAASSNHGMEPAATRRLMPTRLAVAKRAKRGRLHGDPDV
jgi:hypothetical protein